MGTVNFEILLRLKDEASGLVSKFSALFKGVGAQSVSTVNEISSAISAAATKAEGVAQGLANGKSEIEGVSSTVRKVGQATEESARQGVRGFQEYNEKAGAAARGVGDAFASTLSRLREDNELGTENLKENIGIQKKVIADLEKKYQELQAKAASAPTNKLNGIYTQQLGELKNEIEGEKQALSALEKSQQQYSQSTVSVRTQLLNLRNEMANMRLEGKGNTAEYEALRQKMEQLGTVYRELQTEQTALSTGATQLGGVMNGLSGLIGLYSAGSGVLSLFIEDNEKLMKVQTKMQSCMSIMMGLSQTANALHATSAFRIVTVRKVTDLWRAAQNRLTVSFGLSATAAKAFWAAATLGVGAVIGGVITVLSRLANKHRELKKAQEESAKEQRQMYESARQSAAGSIAGQILEYRKLQKAWGALGGDMKAKSLFVKDNKASFDKLGVSVEDVKDAEQLLIDNEANFIKSLRNKAMAAAAMELAAKSYTKYVEAMVDAESQTATSADKTKASVQATTFVQKKYKLSDQQLAGSHEFIEGKRKSQDPQMKAMAKDYDKAYRSYLNTIVAGRKAADSEAASKLLAEGDKYLSFAGKTDPSAMTSGKGSKSGGNDVAEDPRAGSIDAIKAKLKDLSDDLNAAGANERASIQESINLWQGKLDVINEELAAIGRPTEPKTLAELSQAISDYEKKLQNAGDSERAEIQNTINGYKAKKAAIEDSLASLSMPSDTQSLDDINLALSILQKRLGQASEEERGDIQLTINEYNRKKQTITDALDALDVPANPESLDGFSRAISALNAKLLAAGDAERLDIQKTINTMTAKEAARKRMLDLPAIQTQTEGLDGMTGESLKLELQLIGYDKIFDQIATLKAILNDPLSPITGEQKADIESTLASLQRYAKSMTNVKTKSEAATTVLSSVGGVMSSLSGVVGEQAGGWLQWGANILQAIAQAIPQIVALTSVQGANAAANTVAAGTGAAASVASVPYIGPILAIAAIASVVAAIASIPKFAEGGIAYGTTLGVFGEYSGVQSNPEVVAPLDRLRRLIQPRDNDMGGKVRFVIEGRTLVGIIEKESKIRRRTR